jgi:hypothetical protein
MVLLMKLPGTLFLSCALSLTTWLAATLHADSAVANDEGRGEKVVAADSLRGKIMCGYQGWFRCPGDAAGLGWIHYGRGSDKITPESLVFEMWPDVGEMGRDERFAAPGFTHPDGSQAELFSSDHPATVQRHFEWMRDYGIDGAWLQHFLVDLPDQPNANRYDSRRRVLNHVVEAARRTGRVWALSFDIAAMPTDRIFDALTAEWRRLVDEGVTADPRYLREGGRPVVQVWGFYHRNQHNRMTPELGNRLVDFFKAPGRYSAFLVGGGDWDWRRNPDPDWRKLILRLDAYAPWNVGNFALDANGDKHASMSYWAEDKRECEQHGVFWLPVVYPGFSWDNLMRRPPGSTTIARRGGKFLWEQFHELSKLGVDSVYVAMFDEIDEGTAIFKVTSTPPVQGHFVGYDGLPSDWYLRLVGEAGRRLRAGQPVPAEIPIKP